MAGRSLYRSTMRTSCGASGRVMTQYVKVPCSFSSTQSQNFLWEPSVNVDDDLVRSRTRSKSGTERGEVR